jgi:hypothetical protein
VLLKMIDMALDVAFLTIHNLAKFRNRLASRNSRTPADQNREEDAALVAEWVEACKRRDALKTELSEPTTSRLYEAQATLLQTSKAAGDKCHYLLVKMRARRKA